MILKRLLFIGFICFSVTIHAQKGTWPTQGAKSLSMGSAGITTTGIESLFLNQAGLATLEGISIAALSERRFDLINSLGVGFAIPYSKFGTFGLALSNYGISDYSEQKIGLAYGRKLAKNTMIGAQFQLFNTSIEGFGNIALATFEVGLITQILKNVNLGVHVFSPAQISITDNETIPTRIRLGLQYLPSDKVELQLEYDQYIDFGPTVKLGVSYALLESFHLRGGFYSNSSQGNVSFGIGYVWRNQIFIDGAVSYHEFLGFTPGLALKYQFNKVEN